MLTALLRLYLQYPSRTMPCHVPRGTYSMRTTRESEH